MQCTNKEKSVCAPPKECTHGENTIKYHANGGKYKIRFKNMYHFLIIGTYQSIVGTELFSFNSRSVHVRERNFGHFFKGNSVMNVNGTSVTFSQWTECKSLFIFSVRAEQILSREVTNFFLENTFFNCELSKMFIFHKKSCFAFFFWVKKGIIILYT